jgi:fluoroquinolone transport system permease protein
MNALRAARALGRIDAVNVRRDALLRWIVTLPLLIALMARFILPVIIGRLEETLHADLGGIYPVVAGYALLITAPVMCGTVIGFLLLDERDDRTLLALRVTPLPPGGYVAWRLSLPVLLSIIITLVIFPLAGLGSPGVLRLLVCALAASPLAPLVALALAVFAQNKVQGFALVKASGVFQIAPLVAYFIGPAWQPAFGVIPTYWPAKTLWAFQQGEASGWLWLAAGLAYQLLLLAALLRRFNRAVAP